MEHTATEYERQRLDELRGYDLLDTPPEPQFDDLATLAAHICGVPYALVSLVDDRRLFFKAHVGTTLGGLPRDGMFCDALVKSGDDLLLVADATLDDRFNTLSVVTDGPRVRFYAGVPLLSPAGRRLGALCVIDQTPHTLDDRQCDALRALGRQVVSQMELRRGAKDNARLLANARQAERRARHDAAHDDITGLPNRSSIAQTIDDCLADPHAGPFAVLFLDLDRFKVINDSFGHAAGDLLLNTVARRLSTTLDDLAFDGGQSALARFGGDEFVILLRGVSDAATVNAVVESAIHAVGRPFKIGVTAVHPNVSVGVVAGPAGYRSADEMLRDADAALSQAKAGGRGRFVAFDARMHQEAVRRLELESRLRHAVSANELSLQYQPVIDLSGGRVVGFEALVRWRCGGRTISPGEFIPVAEETGLIVPIGQWVLGEAVRQAAEWKRAHPHLPRFKMAVNVSRRQLAEPGLVPLVSELLARHDIEPSRLMLEITESVIMDDATESRRVLGDLRALGVRLAMDDFGTGYSSLGCLNDFDLDVLKVDRSFVANLGRPRESAVMQAVLDLAHGLGLRVVAEGIETPQQLALLTAARCDYGQGYLFAKPLAAADAEAFLAASHAGATLAA